MPDTPANLADLAHRLAALGARIEPSSALTVNDVLDAIIGRLECLADYGSLERRGED